MIDLMLVESENDLLESFFVFTPLQLKKIELFSSYVFHSGNVQILTNI